MNGHEKRSRTMRLTQRVDELRTDVRVALRQLNRARLFTAVAVVTLALGIGANAAVFSVLKAVLIDSLPYADADRLVQVYGRRTDGLQRAALSAATLAAVTERQSPLP
jgi:putative ABC transport system permease protein